VNVPYILGFRGEGGIAGGWFFSFIHGNLLFNFFYEQVQESLNYKSEKGKRKDSLGGVLSLCDRSYNI
jgi:hypothetical protein